MRTYRVKLTESATYRLKDISEFREYYTETAIWEQNHPEHFLYDMQVYYKWIIDHAIDYEAVQDPDYKNEITEEFYNKLKTSIKNLDVTWEEAKARCDNAKSYTWYMTLSEVDYVEYRLKFPWKWSSLD